MECRTPKRIYITGSNGYKYVVYVPCNDCYHCQNKTRGEWVYRVETEVKTRLPFFITLTYDNAHLPVIESLLPDYPRYRRQNYIDDCMCGHKLKRRWDYSYVRKDHLHQFIHDLQAEFKCRFYDEMFEKYLYVSPHGKKYYRDRPLPGMDEKHLMRWYATGEYGTFSHRAHYHALLFFPVKIHRQDVISMVKKVWPYGHIDVAKDCRDAAVNYVAKHQVKSDSGSTFQRRFAPVLKTISTYNGGLGYELDNDFNYDMYCHKDKDGDFDQRYFEFVDGNCNMYKIPMPRMLTKRFRKRYAKENNITVTLTDTELQELSEKTVEKFCIEFLKFISLNPQLQGLSEDDQISAMYAANRREDFLERREYEKKRFSQKRVSLLQKYGLTLNNDDGYESF